MCSFSTTVKEGMPRSFYNDHFVLINQLSDNFSMWEYTLGMRFKDTVQWWGLKGNRVASHEGVDLCCFRDTQGVLHKVEPIWQFPPLFSGSVVGVFADFLGKSILFQHDFFAGNGWRLYSVFGHTLPCKEIVSGAEVCSTRPIVSLAKPLKSSSLTAHLHISLMWISPGHEFEALDWGSIAVSDNIFLIDPLEVL